MNTHDDAQRAIEETMEHAANLSWWTQQLGMNMGTACWYVHQGRDVRALTWVRDIVNDTLTSATWDAHS